MAIVNPQHAQFGALAKLIFDLIALLLFLVGLMKRAIELNDHHWAEPIIRDDEIAMAARVEIKLPLRKERIVLLDDVGKAGLREDLHVVVRRDALKLTVDNLFRAVEYRFDDLHAAIRSDMGLV